MLKISNASINIASLIVAFSGMIYELGLAQIQSAILGGTAVRYAITIGLFTAALGIGALAFEALIKKYSFEKLFLIVQTALAWVGLLSPFLLIHANTDSIISNNLPSIAIGFLSGIELPLLMSLSTEKNRSIVIAFDYLGMFAATLFFPLLLLPKIGVIGTISIASMLNAILAIFLLKTEVFKLKNISIILIFILSIFVFLNQERVLNYASQSFV